LPFTTPVSTPGSLSHWGRVSGDEGTAYLLQGDKGTAFRHKHRDRKMWKIGSGRKTGPRRKSRAAHQRMLAGSPSSPRKLTEATLTRIYICSKSIIGSVERNGYCPLRGRRISTIVPWRHPLHRDRHSMKMLEFPTTGHRDGNTPHRQQPASIGPLNILWGREK